MNEKIFKQAKKILPFLGIIFLIIYIFFNLNFGEIKEAFLQIHPIYVVLSISLTIPRVLIRNSAWNIILKEQRIKISFWQSLKVFLIGYFYGSFTPGFYGQIMRIPYLKDKTGEPYGKLFINTFIEISIRSFSIFSIILIGPLLFFLTMEEVFYRLISVKEVFYLLLLWLLIFVTILLYFSKKERGEKFFYKFIKYFIPKKMKRILSHFIETFYNDFPRIKMLLIPIILSLASWILIFTQEYIFVIALGLSLKIPYVAFLFLYPIVNVAGFIPITFAGIGIREIVAMEVFFVLFAVSKEEIIVFSMLGFLMTNVFTGFIGFLLSLTETIDRNSFLKSI